MSQGPEFSTYSLSELIDARDHVDRNAFSERYQEILKLIDNKTKSTKEPKSAKETQAHKNTIETISEQPYKISSKYQWSICDPLIQNIIEKGSIEKLNIVSTFNEYPWEEMLSKMDRATAKDIYFSPSLEFRDELRGYGITFSAVVEKETYIFYVFYKRPHKDNTDHISEILNQTTESSVILLNLFVEGNYDQLQKIFSGN